MKIDEQIITRLQQMLTAPSIVFPGTVKAVDKINMTCTVTPPDDVDMLDVRLKAAQEELNDGIVEVPALDSSVLVVIIGNREEDAFIVKCSRVEEVLFYGGEHGGLIKVNELVNQLEKVNSYLENLRDAVSQAVVVPNDGGKAFQTAIIASLKGLSLADYSNIENLKVKH